MLQCAKPQRRSIAEWDGTLSNSTCINSNVLYEHCKIAAR